MKKENIHYILIVLSLVIIYDMLFSDSSKSEIFGIISYSVIIMLSISTIIKIRIGKGRKNS